MINGKYPLLIIEIANFPVPFYLDENIFKIAVQGEDSSIGLLTTKTGSETTQVVDQNSLVLNFKASKESQYTTILISLLTKLYDMIANALEYNKYTVDTLLKNLQFKDYSISYFSDTDSITNAVITNFTKTSEVSSNTIDISITLEKKISTISKSVDLTGVSDKIGTETI
jgi:hypothetical protein